MKTVDMALNNPFQAFKRLDTHVCWYPISQEAVEKSFQMLKEFNPRIHYREVEYSAEIYPETINVLQKLKEKGYTIAALTDLPCAMHDEIFRRDISELLGYFDYYVSSTVAGYRKPNCKGLQMISERFSFPITELIFIGDEKKTEERQLMLIANLFGYSVQRRMRKVLVI